MKLIASHILLLQLIAAVQNVQNQQPALSPDNVQGITSTNPRSPHVGQANHAKNHKVKSAGVKSGDSASTKTPNLRVAAVPMQSENSDDQSAVQEGVANRSESSASPSVPAPPSPQQAAAAAVSAPATAQAASPTAASPAPAAPSTGATAPPSAPPSAPAAPAPVSPTDQCLQSCAADDTGCKSHCVRVPNPTQEDMKQNIECVSGCFKSNSGANNAANLIQCLQQCTVQYTSTFDPTVQPISNNSTSSGNSTSDSKSSSTTSSNKSASSSGSNSGASSQYVYISSSLFGLLVTIVALM